MSRRLEGSRRDEPWKPTRARAGEIRVSYSMRGYRLLKDAAVRRTASPLLSFIDPLFVLDMDLPALARSFGYLFRRKHRHPS